MLAVFGYSAVMRIGSLLIGAVLVILIGTGLWLFGTGSEAQVTPVGDAAATKDSEPQPGVEARVEPSSVDTPVAVQREEVEVAAPGVMGDKLAVFRGRCVDVAGRPLAGVKVSVSGWRANTQRMDAYRRDHGEVVFENPEAQLTGADGKFEVTFDPPPPYQFILDLTREDLAGVGGRWSEIESGMVKDFGDLELSEGVLISGRIVDGDGKPVASPSKRARISLDNYNRQSPLSGEIKPKSRSAGTLRPDGSFELRDRLLAGKWKVSLRELQLVTKEVTIETSVTNLQIVVVKPDDPGALPTIRGLVVDDRGEPVRGVSVSPEGRAGGGWSTYSGRDGRFELKMRAEGDPEGKFALRMHKRGYERMTTKVVHAWGEEDVTLIVRRGLHFDIKVVRADDSSPVVKFGVRVLPLNSGFSSSQDREIRGGWEHEGGVLALDGILRGRMAVFVEPVASTGLVQASRELEFDGDQDQSVVIELEAAVEQVVRLRRTDDSLVVGSKVELIDSLGTEIHANSWIRNFASSSYSSAAQGLLIDSEETSKDGAVVVRGALGRQYTLRCLGDHPPVIQLITLSAEVLELAVPVGTTVQAKVKPLSLLDAWRKQAGVSDGSVQSSRSARYAPKIILRRVVDGKTETFPPEYGAGALFDAEGAAAISGAPEGVWDLVLTRYVKREGGASGNSLILRKGLPCRDGQTEVVELDLSEHMPGLLRAVISVDGKPHVGHVSLSRDLAEVYPNGQRAREEIQAKSNGEGKFEVMLPGGSWQVHVQLNPGKAVWARITVDSPVQMVAGQPAEATLYAETARAKVRVEDSAGKPVKGVSLQITNPQGGYAAVQVTATDAEGRAVLIGMEGTFQLKTRIRSLADGNQFQQWSQEIRKKHKNDWDAIRKTSASVQVALQDITMIRGREVSHVIRLPADWDR